MNSRLCLAITACLLTAACTRNTLVMVAPPQPRPLIANCAVPPGSPPLTESGGAISPSVLPDTPAAARAANIGGCAGILFQIDANGMAVNPRVVTEYPLGYGFAGAALAALAQDRFHPPQPGSGWHYLRSYMAPGGLSGAKPLPPIAPLPNRSKATAL